jgi:hypothetical protein
VPGSRECLTSWFRSIYRGEIARSRIISCSTSDLETEVPHRGTESGGAAEKESDSRFGFPIWDEAVFSRGSGQRRDRGAGGRWPHSRPSASFGEGMARWTGANLDGCSKQHLKVNQWRTSLCSAGFSTLPEAACFVNSPGPHCLRNGTQHPYSPLIIFRIGVMFGYCRTKPSMLIL